MQEAEDADEDAPVLPGSILAESCPSPGYMEEADSWAATILDVFGVEDPESHFFIREGELVLKDECVADIPDNWVPDRGTVRNVAEGHALIKGFARHYPLKNREGTVQCLPGTDEPVLATKAMLFLLERCPVLSVLNNHYLSQHAAVNGLSVVLVGLPLDRLRPGIPQTGHFIRTQYCDLCPGDCVPGCRYAALQGFFDEEKSLQVERDKRHKKFAEKPCGNPKPMNNPLRRVHMSSSGKQKSQTLTYGQNMQILCEARENLSLHNRKTRDPEQQLFNGDVINLFAAVIRTLDKLTRDVLRPSPIDKTEYPVYAICQELYAHGVTDICHAWEPPSKTISKTDAEDKLGKKTATPKKKAPSKGKALDKSQVASPVSAGKKRSAEDTPGGSAATPATKRAKRGKK
jgi:hypothetical protein